MGQTSSKPDDSTSTLLTPCVFDLQEMAEKWAVDLLNRAPPLKSNCIIKKYCKPYKASELNLTFVWDDLTVRHAEPLYYDFHENNGFSTVTLMKSHFYNNSPLDQIQNFATNKSTKCSASVTLVRALSAGNQTNVTLRIPDEVLAETSEFGDAISVKNVQNSTTVESSMHWHVDHPVKLAPFSSLSAEVQVVQRQLSAWFSVQSSVTGRITVLVTDPKSNNQLVKVLDSDIASVVKYSSEKQPTIREDQGYLSVDKPVQTASNQEFCWDVSSAAVTFTTKGYCSFEYGVEQYVRIEGNENET